MKSQGIDILKRKVSERGGILIVATLVIVVMLIIAIPFLFKLSAQWRSTERSYRAQAAFNLAEAGVDKVMWEINLDWMDTPYDPTQDPERINWSVDGTTGSIDNIRSADSQVTGDVAITLGEDPDPGGMAPVTRPLESAGMVAFIANRTVDRTVRVILEKYFGSIWDYGFVVDEYFRIKNTQLTVDSYNSNVANYDRKNPGDLGFFAILSDETSSFVVDQGGEWTVNVTGAIAAGGDSLTDGNPSTNPDADSVIDLPKQAEPNITQIALEQAFNLPSVNVFDLHPKETWPDPNDISNWFNTLTYEDGTLLPEADDVYPMFFKDSLYVSGTQSINNNANGVYTSFEIADGGTLYIDGEVTFFVTGFADTESPAHFIMGQGSSIRINPGGSLTLILGKTRFYMGHQSTINVPLVDNSSDLPGQDQPGYPANCIILGMDAFTPDPSIVGDLTKKQGQAIQKDPKVSPPGAVVFEQQVDISAAIYTPLTQVFDIQGMNHADIYGAWIAYSMIFKVAAAFHYDEALGDIMTITGGPPKWRILNWHEKVGGN